MRCSLDPDDLQVILGHSSSSTWDATNGDWAFIWIQVCVSSLQSSRRLILHPSMHVMRCSSGAGCDQSDRKLEHRLHRSTDVSAFGTHVMRCGLDHVRQSSRDRLQNWNLSDAQCPKRTRNEVQRWGPLRTLSTSYWPECFSARDEVQHWPGVLRGGKLELAVA